MEKLHCLLQDGNVTLSAPVDGNCTLSTPMDGKGTLSACVDGKVTLLLLTNQCIRMKQYLFCIVSQCNDAYW